MTILCKNWKLELAQNHVQWWSLVLVMPYFHILLSLRQSFIIIKLNFYETNSPAPLKFTNMEFVCDTSPSILRNGKSESMTK